MTDSIWFRRLVLMVATVMILGLAGSLAVQLAAPPDEEHIESRLAEFEKPLTSPDENAAEWLMAGSAAVVWSDEDRNVIGKASLSPHADWSPALEASVREVLDRQQGALVTLHRAAGLERSSYGIRYTDGLQAKAPDVLVLIQACRLLLAEARVAVADGDEEATLAALATMGRLASSLESESNILTALIGIACDRMMLRVAGEALTSDRGWVGDPGFLDALENSLSDEDLAATMHRVFDVIGFSWSKGLEADPDPDLTMEDNQRIVARHHRLVETPYGTAPDEFESNPDEEALGVFVPNLRNAIPRAQAALAQRQLVRTGIELRRAELADGAYPAGASSISEITTPDPFTGRPLLYSVHGDGSVTVALDGADELLEEVVVKSAATVPPLHLPAP